VLPLGNEAQGAGPTLVGHSGRQKLRGPQGPRGHILPKWPLPTRLGTRTKESNRYASVLAEKPTRAMKVSDAKRKQQHQPTIVLRYKV